MNQKFQEQRAESTEGIRVSVRTAYLPHDSRPHQEYFVFAYEITIQNDSAHRVQLVARKWKIVDGLGRIRRVQGEGVVGKQPILNPGESHTYVSGCDFSTPMGKMGGSFVMIRMGEGEEFQARIPEFSLFARAQLN